MSPPLIEKRLPTHVVVVRVPLFVPQTELVDARLKFDAFQDVIRTVGSLSRLAWEGYLANDMEVELVDASPS